MIHTSNRPNINTERSADLKAAPFILYLRKFHWYACNAENKNMMPTRPSRAIQQSDYACDPHG
jgi:hypothetical protein